MREKDARKENEELKESLAVYWNILDHSSVTSNRALMLLVKKFMINNNKAGCLVEIFEMHGLFKLQR